MWFLHFMLHLKESSHTQPTRHQWWSLIGWNSWLFLLFAHIYPLFTIQVSEGFFLNV